MLADKLRGMLERFSVVVVSGARQVGKSTLLRHELPGWESVVFDPAMDIGNARQDPDLFLNNHPAPLILDEIQYTPELVAAIKRRVDSNLDSGKVGKTNSVRSGHSPRKGQVGRSAGLYVLTGSQQWSVLKSASESLAGRAVFLDLNGFSLGEIAETIEQENWLKRYLDDPRKFVAKPVRRLPTSRTLFEQLWRGFLPEANALEQDWVAEFHRAYLLTYIERDARLMTDVGDWQLFGRFTRLAAALTAQEINHSQFGRELGVTPQTANRWISTLRATFQWHETPAYHGNAIKRISSKPQRLSGRHGTGLQPSVDFHATGPVRSSVGGELCSNPLLSRKSASLPAPWRRRQTCITGVATAAPRSICFSNAMAFSIRLRSNSAPGHHDRMPVALKLSAQHTPT